MYDVKSICYNKQISMKCLNPRWVKQQELIQTVPHLHNNVRLLRGISPGVMMVPYLPPVEPRPPLQTVPTEQF